jgi:glycerate kinase
MAEALGIRFLDASGGVVRGCCGGRLHDIAAIDPAGLDPRVCRADVTVAADVTNPLVGPDGAAHVYAPQKGATPEQVEALEAGLASLAEVVRRDLGVDVACLAGAGAAGGLAAGLVAFLGAGIRSGVETVMEAVGLRAALADADLVLTAEGRCDGQSAFGKAVAGVGAAAREHGVPVVVLAGSVGDGYEKLREQGVAALLSIADGPMSLEDALARGAELLERAAEEVVRLWIAAGGQGHAGA